MASAARKMRPKMTPDDVLDALTRICIEEGSQCKATAEKYPRDRHVWMTSRATVKAIYSDLLDDCKIAGMDVSEYENALKGAF